MRPRPLGIAVALLLLLGGPFVPPTAVPAAPATASLAAHEIEAPETFFGHRMGADGRLASWDELVDYYRMLGEASPRLQVVEMGPSTLGRPFLALFVSSPENLARLDELRALNAMLADPRDATEAEIERATEEGRAVAFQQNTVESVYGEQLLFREWVPQAYIDHHQMGSWGPRLYLPPYAEPIRPDGDPLVWREMSWWGAHIAYKEEEAAMVEVEHGQGRVVLIGFRAQHRAQTHGTFKLVFNALLGGSAGPTRRSEAHVNPPLPLPASRVGAS